MKHLLLIFFALLFCQCTNKKNDALLEIKEIESSYIDDSIKDIIIQYTQEYPQDSSMVLFFNLPVDSVRNQEYGLADYFTLGEFDIPRFEAEISKILCLYTIMLFCSKRQKNLYCSKKQYSTDTKIYRRYIYKQSMVERLFRLRKT